MKAAEAAAALTPTVTCNDGFDIFGEYHDGMCMEHGGVRTEKRTEPVNDPYLVYALVSCWRVRGGPVQCNDPQTETLTYDTPEACEAQVEHMNHGEFKDLLGGGRCVAVHPRPDTTIVDAPGPKLSHVDIGRMRAVFSRNEAAFYRDFEGNPFVDVMQITKISREGVELGGEVYCELTTNRAAVLRKGEMVKVRGAVEFFLTLNFPLKDAS